MKIWLASTLLVVSPITPALAQTPPGAAGSEFKDANGRKCVPGAGVTVCPTPGKIGDIEEYAKINMAGPDGQEIRLGFCVSEKGVPEDLEILQSSGRPRIDTRMLKNFKTWRYNPGTVDGKPARICGMQVGHVIKRPP